MGLYTNLAVWRSQGKVVIFHNQTRVHVSAPFNQKFILLAHRLHGRWKYRTQVWSFKGILVGPVEAAVRTAFGEDVTVIKL